MIVLTFLVYHALLLLRAEYLVDGVVLWEGGTSGKHWLMTLFLGRPLLIVGPCVCLLSPPRSGLGHLDKGDEQCYNRPSQNAKIWQKSQLFTEIKEIISEIWLKEGTYAVTADLQPKLTVTRGTCQVGRDLV